MRLLLQNKSPLETICSALGYHPRTVSAWIARFDAGDSILDRPRSGRPPVIPAEVVPRIISFYCQHNPLPGCSQWSLRWAHDYLRDHPDILHLQRPISQSSLHRLLNAHALKPHRNKYFLQICDPCFFEKMEHIIEVYYSSHKNLFCFDECTGLQALERIAPSLPAGESRPTYHEPEYKRHGTVSLLSILNVGTGTVFTQCIDDHTSPTIISGLQRHAEQFDRSEQLHYICDNYSSHSTELFCQVIADLCNTRLPELNTAEQRRQWLQSPDKRIVFHFVPTHGSWLNLIEIWFGILQQKALKNQSFSSTFDLSQRILEFTGTWNEYFAHPFEWTYTGEGLHEKVVNRLIRWLQMDSSQLRPKFLEKQFLLMQNLVTKYWTKVKRDVWSFLEQTLSEKYKFISDTFTQAQIPATLFSDFHNLLSRKLLAA